MKLSISNIAWDTSEDADVAALLQRYDVAAIDVAPGKYFPDPAQATDTEIETVRRWWEERGIGMTGMQSLLFGTTGLNLFADPAVQQRMLDHLSAVCRIGGALGATRLVFGSPKNRDRGSLSEEDAETAALPFFHRLGDIAARYGVLICLEPNPTRYGANFLTRTDDAARFVARLSHPAVRMQLDVGTIAVNGEDPAALIPQHAPWIGHIHASEPDLVPLGDAGAPHAAAGQAIRAALASHPVCIEMVATREESHLTSIERALRIATTHYAA